MLHEMVGHSFRQFWIQGGDKNTGRLIGKIPEGDLMTIIDSTRGLLPNWLQRNIHYY